MKQRQDLFSDQLIHLIDRGLMSSLSGGAFKDRVISLVQEYSRRMAEGEPLSALFLGLCDFMLDGHLAKMPESALKIYIALNTHDHLRKDKSAVEIMAKMSGLSMADVKQAIEYLRANGCFDTAEEMRVNQDDLISFSNTDPPVGKVGNQNRRAGIMIGKAGAGTRTNVKI
jgi:hypothetical protein